MHVPHMLTLQAFVLLLIALCCTHQAKGRPNVVIILADDLGYGDLGFAPFTSPEMAGLQTPNLKRMASQGLSMTNFHAAAPMCSPSRASIMVGLFPWRLGVDFIYSQDIKKDGSEEMDHEVLPLLPNVAMSLRDAGYYTAHVGKWHLGGISNYDIAARANHSAGPCFVPGINQYGFDEYVAMTEGWEGKVAGKVWSSRSKTHEDGNTYSIGARYLIRNDVPLPRRARDECLTDRQTEEAMRVVTEQVFLRRPFFLNLWYDAPHSPWEGIEPFYSQYSGKFSSQVLLRKYASMVSNMDFNIGRLLDLFDSLGIANNTLVVFTSDNGPENGAGYTGGLKGRKRLLTEGGIRVPCIWQWKGHIEAGSLSDKFALTTDLFPTILHAVKERFPLQARIDGVSILPVLLAGRQGKAVAGLGDERVVLWYAHAPDYPKLTAAVAYGIKVLWNDYEDRKAVNLPPTLRVFDLRLDPREEVNLLPALTRAECGGAAAGSGSSRVTWQDLRGMDHGKLLALAARPTEWATSADLAHQAMRLISHLYLRMHLFRHLGDVDWRRYHANKPFERHPNCRIRTVATAEVIQFDEGGVLVPEFCGEGVYAASLRGGRGCACSIGECSTRWRKGGGWEEGAVVAGLSGFAPASAGASDAAPWPQSWTAHTYLKEVLAASRYRAVCPAAGLTDATYERSIAAGTAAGSGHCGGMAASLWINNLGMGAPLALCPSGLRSLIAGSLDENAMQALLSDLLYSPQQEVRRVLARLRHAAFARAAGGSWVKGDEAEDVAIGRRGKGRKMGQLVVAAMAHPHRSLVLLNPSLVATSPAASVLSLRLAGLQGPHLLSLLPLRLNSSSWSLAVSVASPAVRSARVVLIWAAGGATGGAAEEAAGAQAEAVFSRAYAAVGFSVTSEAVAVPALAGSRSSHNSGAGVVFYAAQVLSLFAAEGAEGLSAKRLGALLVAADAGLDSALLPELAALYCKRGRESWEKTKEYLDLMSKKGSGGKV